MKLRSFHLSVRSPTNDYGPDFLIVELTQRDIDEIRRLADSVRALEVYSIHTFDHRPTWYRGDPEYVCEELFADVDGTVDRVGFIEENIEEVRIEVPCLVITDDEVYWVAESSGGDLYASEPVMIESLARKFGLAQSPLARLDELIRQGCEFPIAEWRVSREYELTPDAVMSLKADYDRMCVEG